jgi:RNA polymerase sigma-70 factor (ECF subfamily)
LGIFKTSSKEIAEDLVQDTFLAAFHKIDSFEGKSQPKTGFSTQQ